MCLIAPGLILPWRIRQRLCIFLYSFCDLCNVVEFAYRTNMVGRCFHRMLLLLQLAACILAYNDTDQCQVCQTPLTQNPRVPWHNLLKNTTYYFSGLKLRGMIQNLPNHSFVSGPYIQVCICKSYDSPRNKPLIWLCYFLFPFVRYSLLVLLINRSILSIWMISISF